MNKYLKLIKREQLQSHKIVFHDDGDGGKYKTSKLFDDTIITEGGWYCGRKWMTAKQIDDAETRWVKHSYVTGAWQDDYDGWIAHQCGGCRWFAALDLDYGICCNEISPNDGRVTFEHGGCVKHSDLGNEVESDIEL